MSEAHYIPAEERMNIITHAVGIVLSLVAMIFLIIKAEDLQSIIGVSVFGVSLILLYTASTLYHSAKDRALRSRLRIFDHAAIFVLIAGTYTPICMITLSESIGDWLLIIIWSIAILGILLKLFLTGKYDKLSTAMYVAMGWVAIIAIQHLLGYMSSGELFWLLAGGAFYTIGAILYSIKAIPFNHAIFHLFVLAGSGSHFIMVYSHTI